MSDSKDKTEKSTEGPPEKTKDGGSKAMKSEINALLEKAKNSNKSKKESPAAESSQKEKPVEKKKKVEEKKVDQKKVEENKEETTFLQSLINSILYILKTVALMFMIIVLLVGYQQESMLYLPTQPVQYPHQMEFGYQDPQQSGLPYKNLTLTTDDNVQIRGWFIYGNGSHKLSKSGIAKYKDDQRPTLVFMHENAGNIGMRIPQYKFLIKNLQVNILSMAYRGYSYSDQVPPTEAGLKKDADAIAKFLAQPEIVDEDVAVHINPQLIFAHGRSLGGAVAIYTVHSNPQLFRGMIIENTFTSISAMADHLFPFLRPAKPFILKIGWYSDQLVPDIRIPAFFVTGDQDEIVPYGQTVQLYEMANQTRFKDLYVVKDGDHNGSFLKDPRSYLTKLDNFLKRCMLEYEPSWMDDWQNAESGSSDGESPSRKKQRQELLDIQQENNDKKVKVKSVRMPSGTLDKLKEDAKKQKTAGAKMATGGAPMPNQNNNEEL